ncbi:MAG: hypothetical protein E6I94_08520 [Chloroflexi bacterium]|nr:MAG: hypothetical protein E6I94_08520 [Chloroflexota bacterium]
MDLIGTVLILIGAGAPLAILLAWLATRGLPGLGLLVGIGQADAWWRSSMPWPTGIQEDDDVRWHFHDGNGPDEASTIEESTDWAHVALRVDPSRVRPSVHVRQRD